MAYDQAGPADGKLVVLLHAGVADRRMWDRQWAGHLPSLERPDEITELLLDTLAPARG